MLIVCKDYKLKRERKQYNKVSDYKEIRTCYTMKKK